MSSRVWRVCALSVLAIINVIAVFFVCCSYIGFRNAPPGGSGVDYLSYYIGMGAATAFLLALILLDDFLLQHGFFKKAKGQPKMARYYINLICRILCLAFISWVAIGSIFGTDPPAGVLKIKPVWSFPAALVILRVCDFVIWLWERRKKRRGEE